MRRPWWRRLPWPGCGGKLAERHRGPRRGGRALARYRVVQVLYAWRQGGPLPAAGFAAVADEPGGDLEYSDRLLAQLETHASSLRSRMETVLDRSPDALDPVEYSIILVGLCELLYCPDVPVPVIIDEAIEIAQLLAGTDADKYVNAVLDKAASRLRPAP